jgi:hypothetical protein
VGEDTGVADEPGLVGQRVLRGSCRCPGVVLRPYGDGWIVLDDQDHLERIVARDDLTVVD